MGPATTATATRIGPEPVEGHEPARSPAIGKSKRLQTTVSPVTRRRFLIFCGVVGAAGIAAGATQVHWSDLVSAAAKTHLDPADGILVIVTLYGGNDGLNTVIPAYSEFGRRVLANASDGTDHGTAGVFLLARGVRGGFFGAEPSLTDLDDGDLKAGNRLPVDLRHTS